MQDMFCAENISKSFRLKNGRTLAALDSVSFAVRPGGIAALVGPDGAGKSTLLRMAAGLLRPNSGSFLFEGQAFGSEREDLLAQVAYMPQKFGLYEDLTVQENLDLYADLKGVGKKEREERYQELLAMSALEPFRQRLAGKLSGGMKQKLGLICTLIAPPKLLLLDEPTVGVDPLSRRELWEIVARLTGTGPGGTGMSVIVSTSYLDEAARCDEVVLLFEGKTLARGAPESIRQRTEGMGYLAKPASGETPRSLQARLLGAPGIIDAVPQGGAVRFIHGPLDEERSAALRTLLRGAEVREVPASLEDSFMLLLREHMDKAGGMADAPPSGPASGPASALANDGPQAAVTGSDDSDSAVFGSVGSGSVRSASAGSGSVLSTSAGSGTAHTGAAHADKGEPVILTQNVSRFFGDFIAVDNVSFSVFAGEVFGLLGPNGAGKTTTFRMLCGLLPASRGSLHVAGVDVREARQEARRHLGYVAQKFSLYGPLSVRENLDFFAGAYGLRGQRKNMRIQEVVAEFSLERQLHMAAENLPGGYKQRLAMAVGLLHEPAILFLDEPTSGADPLARRDFWKRISRLAEQGVTIVVTTHFMEEAEYCDRILIQDNGVMLALGTPEEIRDSVAGQPDGAPAAGEASGASAMSPDSAPAMSTSLPPSMASSVPLSMPTSVPLSMPLSMEDAFIAIVAKARSAKKEHTA